VGNGKRGGQLDGLPQQGNGPFQSAVVPGFSGFEEHQAIFLVVSSVVWILPQTLFEGGGGVLPTSRCSLGYGQSQVGFGRVRIDFESPAVGSDGVLAVEHGRFRQSLHSKETVGAGNAGHTLIGNTDQNPPNLMLGQQLHGVQIVGLLSRFQLHCLFEGGNGALQLVLSRITVTQQVEDWPGALSLLDRLQQSSVTVVDPV